MKRIITLTIFTLTLPFLLFAITQAAGDSAWKPQTQIKLPAKASSLSYSIDGSRIAVGHPDGRVSICDAKSGTLTRSLNAHSKEVNTCLLYTSDAADERSSVD